MKNHRLCRWVPFIFLLPIHTQIAANSAAILFYVGIELLRENYAISVVIGWQQALQKKYRTTRAASNMRKAWGRVKAALPRFFKFSNYRARYEKTPSTVLKLRDSSQRQNFFKMCGSDGGADLPHNEKTLTISRKGIISLASPRGFEPLSTAWKAVVLGRLDDGDALWSCDGWAARTRTLISGARIRRPANWTTAHRENGTYAKPALLSIKKSKKI